MYALYALLAMRVYNTLLALPATPNESRIHATSSGVRPMYVEPFTNTSGDKRCFAAAGPNSCARQVQNGDAAVCSERT